MSRFKKKHEIQTLLNPPFLYQGHHLQFHRILAEILRVPTCQAVPLALPTVSFEQSHQVCVRLSRCTTVFPPIKKRYHKFRRIPMGLFKRSHKKRVQHTSDLTAIGSPYLLPLQRGSENSVSPSQPALLP